ncbi:septum formation initiator family protein [Saxibacter everestensis]|uniref:Septum formation initiator family protein n=1 Tax=Saxibacter everestensis TaxID=2909229 RepID=A0ABY8QPM1_9MICO|nr:septum formation initiator family protein [Brevibacteriaceae bacterium ZFBP1038]
MGKQVPASPRRPATRKTVSAARKPAPAARKTPNAAGVSRPRAASRDRIIDDPPQDPTRKGRQLSGRTIAFCVVLLLLALLFAPAVRSMVSQQQQIAALEKDIAAKEKTVQGLREERANWDDPDYVRAQARKQIYYVMPGEKGYIVLDEQDEEALKTDDKVNDGKVALPDKEKSWYVGLWDSVTRAGTEDPVEDTR